MERRRHSRIPAQFPARLRKLGEGEREIDVTVEEISRAGARLRAAELVPLSAPVKLEWEDAMYLGECVHTTADAAGGYIVGIHFEQVISGLQDLRNLMVRLTAEADTAGNDTGIEEQENATIAWRSRKFRKRD